MDRARYLGIAGDKVEHYHELHAVETADKRIIIHVRNHNAQHNNETLQCESSDGGKTWTAPKSIGVWGLPSHLLRLREIGQYRQLIAETKSELDRLGASEIRLRNELQLPVVLDQLIFIMAVAGQPAPTVQARLAS